VHVDTDAEISGLRTLLRDLVALSAIPAVWVERAATTPEPGTEAVATGLVDALVGLLELDFAFVRLSDPAGGAEAVDVTRGVAWRQFPEWLESQLAGDARLTRKELVFDVGHGAEACGGVAVPIGRAGMGGVIAAASERSDFPTPTEQLLLSLAANQAGTAFQSARLIHERKRAERELREARDELETKISDRTAELARSEAYLAEGQRLTHTGSLAIDVSTRQVSHSSAEHLRLFGFDPEQGTPSLSALLERIHPQDRAKCTEALERGIRHAGNLDVEYRVVLPRTPVRHHRAIGHPVFDASGELVELVGTIVDVTERRHAETELQRLAGEQAALRRVAMLVAEGASPTAVFDAVAAEMERLLDADGVTLSRYEPADEVTVVAHRGANASKVPPGTRVSHAGENVTSIVRRSERPARLEHYEGTDGPIAALARELGVRASVAAPIVVEGRLWGVTIANWRGEESPPADTEARMAQFAELLDTAIANANSRAELMASRARLVAASDEARRGFERDLHDGVQQRLVGLSLELRAAEAMASPEDDELVRQLAQVGEGLAEALEELRELSRGIHPAILSKGGLALALNALARRSAVPASLDLAVDRRLADRIEVGAYYVVSEALTNAAKHAQASKVEIHARAGRRVLELTIVDDGVGGADPAQGSGLTGLSDRIEALGGTIAIVSPPGQGTSLRVELPLEGR
jgi:signal transduction histidine kinase/PAS domain-containing protein